MARLTTVLMLIGSLTMVGSHSAAADSFDGKTPLLCSIYQLHECDHPNGCTAVTPSEVNGVSHFDLNFRDMLLSRAGVDSGQESVIRSVSTIDSKLIIQGAEDGRPDERDGAGWTVTVMDPEGTMTMTSAGDGFAIVGLGACVPQ